MILFFTVTQSWPSTKAFPDTEERATSPRESQYVTPSGSGPERRHVENKDYMWTRSVIHSFHQVDWLNVWLIGLGWVGLGYVEWCAKLTPLLHHYSQNHNNSLHRMHCVSNRKCTPQALLFFWEKESNCLQSETNEEKKYPLESSQQIAKKWREEEWSWAATSQF